MKALVITILIFFVAIRANAQTFNELIKDIDSHSKIESLKNKKQAIAKEGKAKSKWSEPQLKIDAMNLPSQDPKLGLSPMSSVGVTISQKVPLTSKYSNILKSYNSLADTQKYKLEILKREIILEVWNYAIKKDKIIKHNYP